MPACSDVARALGEPLAGTAPHAAIWLAVEQPGPWGAKALIDSHLDHALGAELTRRMADLPVRAVLVRRTGHHADPGPTTPRTVFVARTTGSPRLWRAVVDDPRAVLDLDLHGLVSGAEPTFGAPVTTPVTLVCTNGRRDVCCAVRGRQVAVELAAAGADVWECSHVGGHRFSPTVVRLPDGWVFGGVEAAAMTTAACRGRSALVPAAQAAELAVLADRHVDPPVALRVADSGNDEFLVDGVPVTVRLEAVTAHRPESCGSEPVAALTPVARRSV